MLRPAAAALAVAAALAAGSASGGNVRTGTVACPTRAFEVSFDPKQRVVVTSGGKVLASATFSSRMLSGACRRMPEPKTFVDGGLGPEIRSVVGFRCLTTAPIRIHVNPIRDDAGKIVGSSLGVGTGDERLRVIVSAVLKNRGDPYAARLYRARSNCKLGAKRSS